ncbi:MAG TPA: hypothetical protein VHM26_03050 [Chitinophagaceae bacterium]|jgi:hypothetical protein|nr:hypothetical protein [Chitinophagaceae bacterium]
MKKVITYCFAFSACIVLLLVTTKHDAAAKKAPPCKMEQQSNPVSIDNNFFTDNI